jgi:hypothetical protein
MKAYRGVELKLHTFLTSALDGDEWSTACRGRFTPVEVGRSPDPVWRLRTKGLSLNGNRSPTVQPVASHFTD